MSGKCVKLNITLCNLKQLKSEKHDTIELRPNEVAKKHLDTIFIGTLMLGKCSLVKEDIDLFYALV